MLNKVMLIGNLGRDPEMRALPSGEQVANFSIATTRKWKDRSGQKQEETEWHNIAVFGRTAEACGQYLTKGKKVYVEGRIRTRSWDDKTTGEKKYRTEVVAESVQFLSPSEGGGGQRRDEDRGYGGGYSAPSSGGYAGGGGPPDDDDDIPF